LKHSIKISFFTLAIVAGVDTDDVNYDSNLHENPYDKKLLIKISPQENITAFGNTSNNCVEEKNSTPFEEEVKKAENIFNNQEFEEYYQKNKL